MMTKIRDIMARRAAGEKGFTLIELLVVVVILVVLAAIAVPIFLGQATKARNAKAASSVAAIGNVLSNARSLDATVTGAGTVAAVVNSEISAYDAGSGTQTINGAGATVSYTTIADGKSTFTVSLKAQGGCTYTMTQADSQPVSSGC